MNYTTKDLSKLTNLAISTINKRARDLGIINKQGEKKLFDKEQVEQIVNYKPKRTIYKKNLHEKMKYNKKKISIIDFFLTHKNNSAVEIAEKMGIPIWHVNKTINEWIENEQTITVASKL